MRKIITVPRSKTQAVDSINIAEAKRCFADLIGRVAYGGATVLITRRGKPMAKLVPVGAPDEAPSLAEIRGWLDADDAFFSDIQTTVERRVEHAPRAIAPPVRAPRRRRARP